MRLRPPALLFGVAIDDLTMPDTLAEIERLVALGRTTGRTHQIATVNVDFLVNALHADETRRILQHADLCVADGMPVVWAANRLGMPVRERVAGADLVPALVDASRTTGWRVHVFGSDPAVAAAARTLLDERYPGATFSIDPGPMIPDVRAVGDDVLEGIAAVDADILCVALGNPKQERFIAAHRDRLRTPVMIGVGGSLDMLVGKRKRAPEWVQRAGLEWVARAVQEPRRLGRRYAHDIRVILPAYARLRRVGRSMPATTLTLDSRGDHVVARLSAATVTSSTGWAAAAEAICAGADLRVDAGHVDGVSPPVLGTLVGLCRLARQSGRAVTWTQTSDALRSSIARLWIDDHAGLLGLT